ncbi:MAG: type IX secretion system protein PorQ [Bacteroidota bacterium]
MRKYFLILLLLPFTLSAQIGGRAGFQALNLTSNPRTAALSGSAVSLADGDLSQFFENPAILDSVAEKDLFLHINPYFADVSILSAAYRFDIKRVQGFAVGVNYINYGDFQLTDESGQNLGSFGARDYVLALGKAHQLGPVTLGVNLKFINNAIDSYSSSAFAADLGGIFRVNKNWTFGMVISNMGFVVSGNSPTRAHIPLDVSIGTSFKPEYMPLRFTVTSVNLTERNFSISDDEAGRTNSGLDKALRRVHLGAELLLSNHFQLLFGYHHKRKQELRLESLGGGAGFSYGLMLKIKQIQLRFSRATFHAAGGTSFISLQTNLNEFKKIL